MNIVTTSFDFKMLLIHTVDGRNNHKNNAAFSNSSGIYNVDAALPNL